MLAPVGACSNGTAALMVRAALQFFAATQCLVDEPWPTSAAVEVFSDHCGRGEIEAKAPYFNGWDKPHERKHRADGVHVDFIIVGAGTAGCTVASRLAQVYQYKVLLVEAGGQPPQESIIPGFKDELKASPYDWNFTTVNDGFSSQGLKDGSQRHSRGKALGGTGSIGDMVYSRGHPSDYNEWADIVGSAWNWTNVLEYFKKTERMTDEHIINNNDLMKLHGCCGEIEVTGASVTTNATDRLLAAFNELGFDIVDDMTNPYKIGAGRFSHTISKGRRGSSLTALLDNVHTDNLSVLNGTLVTKILFEKNKSIGISAIVNNEIVNYYADKEVILSAGTFNTPKLMMLSGVGPKDHLTDLGIKVIKDLQVGNNLHDHVMVLNYLAVNKGTCTYEKSTKYFQMFKYLYNRTGIFAQSDSMGLYLAKKGEDPNIPYFAIYPSCMPLSELTLARCRNVMGYAKSVCNKLVNINKDYELIVLPVVLLKPQSRGKVRLNSKDATQKPLIYSGTFSNLADFAGYSKAIQVATSIADTTYFKSRGARRLDYVWSNCLEIEDEESRIRCMVKDYAIPAWHSVGTAAMGLVVDDKLKVIGVDGLRVVDASVIPVVVRGNINAAVVMVAEKAADFIKETHNLENSNSRNLNEDNADIR